MKRIAKVVVLLGGFIAATQASAADSSVFRPEAPRFQNETGAGEKTYTAQQPVNPYVERSDYPLGAGSTREQVTPPTRSTYEEYSNSQASGSDDFPAQVIGAH